MEGFILEALIAWTQAIQQIRDVIWWKEGLSRPEYVVHSGMSDLSDISLLIFSLSTNQSHPSYHVFCISSISSCWEHTVTKSSGLYNRALGKFDVLK